MIIVSLHCISFFSCCCLLLIYPSLYRQFAFRYIIFVWIPYFANNQNIWQKKIFILSQWMFFLCFRIESKQTKNVLCFCCCCCCWDAFWVNAEAMDRWSVGWSYRIAYNIHSLTIFFIYLVICLSHCLLIDCMNDVLCCVCDVGSLFTFYDCLLSIHPIENDIVVVVFGREQQRRTKKNKIKNLPSSTPSLFFLSTGYWLTILFTTWFASFIHLNLIILFVDDDDCHIDILLFYMHII